MLKLAHAATLDEWSGDAEPLYDDCIHPSSLLEMCLVFGPTHPALMLQSQMGYMLQSTVNSV